VRCRRPALKRTLRIQIARYRRLVISNDDESVIPPGLEIPALFRASRVERPAERPARRFVRLSRWMRRKSK
jgi:hypothetical protein